MHVLQPGRTGVDVPKRGARVLVAGVGNMFLRDDGFGPEVARRLASGGLDRGADPRWTRSRPVGGPGGAGSKLLTTASAACTWPTICSPAWTSWCWWMPCRRTERGDTAPGSIRVLQVRSGDLDSSASFDPHGMDPVAVLGRLRSLGGELPLTYVVGCVPADLAEGIGLSAPVAAAVPAALAAVGDLLALYASVNP